MPAEGEKAMQARKNVNLHTFSFAITRKTQQLREGSQAQTYVKTNLFSPCNRQKDMTAQSKVQAHVKIATFDK